MQVRIIETNEIKDLTAKSWSSTTSWTDWTADLLGNWDALQRDEEDVAVMTEEDFGWWEDIVEKLNTINLAKQTTTWHDYLSEHTLDNGQYDDELQEYCELQEDTDLDCIVEAELEWMMLHGIIETAD